jgi:integrating conjugative element protein (TIGR03759 family)
MSKHSLWLTLSLWVLQVTGTSAQEPVQNSSISTSPLSTTPLRPAAEHDLSAQSAQDWGLTHEEWVRYRQLMRGPLGVYSPNLDPLTALGTEARNEGERRHIAELQVQMEAQRVGKLLAYQKAYDAAWKRIYPTMLPFQSPRAGTDSVRLAVFVKEDCSRCDQRVKDLEGSGEPFDLYMIGTRGEDARIRAWASRLKIDPAKVRAGTITLNHDAGRWLSLGISGPLPAVLHSVNGQWTRE